MSEQLQNNGPPATEKDGKTAMIPGPLMKRYYRIDEVARYFSVSVRTVYRLLDEGDLKTIRIRGCVRVPAEEIGRFEERLHEEGLGEDF